MKYIIESTKTNAETRKPQKTDDVADIFQVSSRTGQAIK